jgi:hypothetical protein
MLVFASRRLRASATLTAIASVSAAPPPVFVVPVPQFGRGLAARRTIRLPRLV